MAAATQPEAIYRIGPSQPRSGGSLEEPDHEIVAWQGFERLLSGLSFPMSTNATRIEVWSFIDPFKRNAMLWRASETSCL